MARGLVHVHAIIRLDHPDDRAKPAGLHVSADELAAAIHTAAGRTSVQGHAGGGEVLELRLGEQVDTTRQGRANASRAAAHSPVWDCAIEYQPPGSSSTLRAVP